MENQPYLVVPEGAQNVPPSAWVPTKIDLGGMFYDRLLAPDGKIVGVQYHGMGNDLRAHPVLSRFLGDTRFLFDPGGGHVDIVFDARDASGLGHLEVNVTQEFGYDLVLQHGEWLAISFELWTD